MANRKKYTLRLAALLLATGALGACNGSLSINLTDTPVDGAASVVIDFTGVELHNTNGTTTTITFPSPQRIDVLQLRNGNVAALLHAHSVPTGTYDWIRLNILATQDTQGQSAITLNSGQQFPLYIPSGSETGLQLNTSFTVGTSSTTQLIVDFNLRQSITSTDGQNYALVPALRVANQADVGTLTATVDLNALSTAQLGGGAQAGQCNGALFVFSGSTVTPRNGGGSSLVDFQPIPFDATAMQVPVSIPNLPSGSYTVAATCDYNLYDPAAVPGQSGYQGLHWTVLNNVSVKANTTATAILPSSSTSNIVN